MQLYYGLDQMGMVDRDEKVGGVVLGIQETFLRAGGASGAY